MSVVMQSRIPIQFHHESSLSGVIDRTRIKEEIVAARFLAWLGNSSWSSAGDSGEVYFFSLGATYSLE